MLEHAKARLFAKEGRSLSAYVREKQNAIFVRPTVWSVLGYLRDAQRDKYLVEMQDLFAAPLRLHLRYLLIEFIGQIREPNEHEIALLAECLVNPEDRVRALIAIRGKQVWFRSLQASHFPIVMQGPREQQWAMIGIIVDAWDFARDTCLAMIEQYWLPDPTKDELTWRAMREIGEWDARSIEIVCSVIRRADGSAGRLFWAEDLVYAVSANQPDLAPRVFLETERRLDSEGHAAAKSRHNSPLESSHNWYELPAVADAAPTEFLRTTWLWLVKTCEKYHTEATSSVLYQYAGYCMSLEERPGRPDSPIPKAFCVAIDALATRSPEQFVELTRQSWSSENAVVHQFLIRGLCRAVDKNPTIGLAYLAEDRRRFSLGSYESNRQSASMELIVALATHLDQDSRLQLEQLILSWSMYRDGIDLSQEQRNWDREARLCLLSAIPPELLSARAFDVVQAESAALPGWNQKGISDHGGFVRQIPPMTKEQMLISTNGDILESLKTCKEPDRSNGMWTRTEDGWEEPGGVIAAGRELAELATEHPQRAVEIIKVLVANGQEVGAGEALHRLSSTDLSDDEVLSVARSLGSLNPQTEALRADISALLYGRCKTGVGLPDDICNLLAKWLAEPWDSSHSGLADVEPKDDDSPPDSVQSILWVSGRDILDTDRSFWSLLALTNGYLMRTPPESALWLNVVEEHLHRDISVRTWAAYCSELRWIRSTGCDRTHGVAVITELFHRFPSLNLRREGIRLVAHVSDLLAADFLTVFFDALRASKSFAVRQAFGELLTLIAFRDRNHAWSKKRLDAELAAIEQNDARDEPIAVGMAFAASQLWDEPQARAMAVSVLSRLIPNATRRIGQAIGTVFWAREDFAADDATEMLLNACADHPKSLSEIAVSDLVEHLAALLPHKRRLVLRVCNAILSSGRNESRLFEIGPNLVKIAMTLQRFTDTRTEGLSLLEELLRLGLDDAFRMLQEVDVRPTATAAREPRQRRRRKRP